MDRFMGDHLLVRAYEVRREPLTDRLAVTRGPGYLVGRWRYDG